MLGKKLAYHGEQCITERLTSASALPQEMRKQHLKWWLTRAAESSQVLSSAQPCLYTSPHAGNVLLRSFSTSSPQFLHPLCPAAPSVCWPWPAALGHCRTCVSLSWIWDKHHELGLGCVWGVELGSEDLEQLCWSTPVFTVFKITDAQVLRNQTWGHPILPPGPRKGLNHFWEANYQKKIFWEQKNNCLNITS